MLKSLLIGTGTVVAVGYVALCALLFFRQRAMLYYPTPASARTDAPALWIDTEGARLKVWVVGPRAGNATVPALLYFGGNAEEVAGNIEQFATAFPGRFLYLVNYRGYGGSTGTPREADLLRDGVAVFDAVRRLHPQGQIAVMGRSLGSGVAVHVAAERPVDALVLVTPFDRMANVAREHYAWLPVGWLLQERYESLRAVRGGTVRARTLIIVATDDEVIPARRGEALAAAFPAGQARVVRIAGATHNSIDLFPEYLDTVRDFLESPSP